MRFIVKQFSLMLKYLSFCYAKFKNLYILIEMFSLICLIENLQIILAHYGQPGRGRLFDMKVESTYVFLRTYYV